MTKERAAALAAHDFFARYGAGPWDDLRAALGDKVTDDLLAYFIGRRVVALEAEATAAVAESEKAAAGAWEVAAEEGERAEL